MRNDTWFLSGTWDELEKVRADVDSTIYGLCEEVSDYGKKYQISLEVTEIS